MSAALAEERSSPIVVLSVMVLGKEEGMSRALTPGTVFVIQVAVGSRSLNVGADVLGFSRPCRSTLVLGFQCLTFSSS